MISWSCVIHCNNCTQNNFFVPRSLCPQLWSFLSRSVIKTPIVFARLGRFGEQLIQQQLHLQSTDDRDVRRTIAYTKEILPLASNTNHEHRTSIKFSLVHHFILVPKVCNDAFFSSAKISNIFHFFEDKGERQNIKRKLNSWRNKFWYTKYEWMLLVFNVVPVPWCSCAWEKWKVKDKLKSV